MARRTQNKPSGEPAGKAARRSGRYRAKVRMYRQGLGDCFLVALPRTGEKRPYYVMIDCGVILGTADPGARMTSVMDDIISTTAGEIDLLVVTHEHWDHVSGFVQAKDAFAKLAVGEVWLAWTEDLSDPLTAKLKAERAQALAALRLGLSRLQLAGASDVEAEELGGVLEFFGAAKGMSTGDALEIVRAKAGKLRYCRPSDDPFMPPGTGARFYVLGPPQDEKRLRKINPSARDRETYGLALDGFGIYMNGAGTAMSAIDRGRPFDQQYEIPFPYAAQTDFFKEHYWSSTTSGGGWRRIDTDWLAGSSDLALQLDSLTNNTSLALAIELPKGDVLLFVADAQVGNWLSWQDLVWMVEGKSVVGPDLLKRAILYKVGHHGSHNATLREKGLEQMENLRIAMIPVDEKMAKTKRWNHMPLDELLAALGERVNGAVLRADKPAPATRENVVEHTLFFEVTF